MRELANIGTDESEKLRKLDLQDALNVIDAAKDLHIPNIKNHNLVRVKKLCITLTREGHAIPALHQVHLTLVVCLTHSQKGETEAYVVCLNLNLSVAWSGEKASFGGCIAFSPGCSDSEAVKAAVALWPQAVFCNAFRKALEGAGVEDNGPASRISLIRSICQLQD